MKRIKGLSGIAVAGLAGVLMLAGGARADTLRNMALWAQPQERASVSNRLVSFGLRDAEAIAAVLASDWEEARVVDLALAQEAYGLLAWVGRRMYGDPLSTASLEKIRQALLAREELPDAGLRLVELLPLEARGAFAPQLYDIVARGGAYADQPVMGRHFVRHTVLRNEQLFSAAREPDDLVELLLAPEPLILRDAERLKQAIKDSAVRLARAKLRAEGRSFVVQDGVNPLSEMIRPVIEALNRPYCAGLEAALWALGADTPEREREELAWLATQWEAQWMAGEMNTPRVLGKLSVALGVEGFNAFVEAYNHGTGEGDDKAR